MQNSNTKDTKNSENDNSNIIKYSFSSNKELWIIAIIIIIAAYFLFIHKDESEHAFLTGGKNSQLNFQQLSDMVTSNISPLSSTIGTINLNSNSI